MAAAGTGIFPAKGEIFMTLCSSTNSHGPCTRLRIRTAIVPLVLGFMLAMAAPNRAHSPDPAPSTQRSPEAERLTHTLLTLTAQLHVAATAERVRLLSNLLGVAAARQQLLAELAMQNPAEVLRVALPAHLRAGLPPALEPSMEEGVVIPGVLEVLHKDRDRGSRYLYLLEAAGERFSPHFAAEPPDLLSGSRVRVSGLCINKALALASGKMSATALTSIAPNTLGAQSTLVILVNFQDKATQPYTVDYARNVAFTTASDFDSENSYQQTWLIGDVAGWYTVPLNSTVCDYPSIASYAKSAASAAGV